MNIIEQIEQEEIIRQADKREVPTFGPGDTLRVSVRVLKELGSVFRCLKGSA